VTPVTDQPSNPPRLLNAEEQEAFECLARYMAIVWHGWDMKSNASEAASAIHVLQGHVVQHAICRKYPGEFSNWWRGRPASSAVSPVRDLPVDQRRAEQ
jgi:hypothetical protein